MRKFILCTLFTMAVGATSIHGQEWETNYESALKTASDKSMPIVLVFQGSDWCAPCIKLDKQIWSTTEFKTYAEGHYVMLQADFPRKKKNALPPEQQENNNMLAERYNQSGIFPLVAVLDNTGKLLGQTGYKKMTPAEYIEHINSFVK